MIDHADLVRRLREMAEYKYQYHTVHAPTVMAQAADAIEALQAERDSFRADWHKAMDELAEMRGAIEVLKAGP